jgi:hypothetical protein
MTNDDGSPRGLQRCGHCNDWRGQCLDPSPQFAGQLMTVHCYCNRRGQGQGLRPENCEVACKHLRDALCCRLPNHPEEPMRFADQEARVNQLKAVANTYFAALTKRDVSPVPWADDIVLRSPLAPQGLDVPLTGRAAVVAWFETLYPVLGEAKVIEHYFSEDLKTIATRADVAITSPPSVLRVVDRFTVDANGRITHQENHYDPRPAMAPTR